MRTLLLAAAVLAVLAGCGAPHDGRAVTVGTLTISNGWAAPTPNGAKTSAGYLKIENHGDQDAHLIGASSARAASVELHVTEMQAGMMVMKHADVLGVPAHGVLEFKPGGAHLMFFAPSPPFKPGEAIPVTLVFKQAGPVAYSLTVRAAGGGAMSGMQ